MNARRMNPHCTLRVRPVAWMLAVVLWLLAVSAVACEPGDEDSQAGKPALSQIWLGEWRDDLPAGVSLITPGGLINHSLPALSADRSRIAILHYAGHPVMGGYPRFEIHSTATLALQERIELVPEAEAERNPNLRDPQLLARIEGLLDEINVRLREGGFRPMETLFELPQSGPLDGVESLGKRIDYERSMENPYLIITSLVSGRIELKMKMPSEFVPSGRAPDYVCGRGGEPRQAWYDPTLRIMVLRVDYIGSTDGCELPEEWHVKRLGDP